MQMGLLLLVVFINLSDYSCGELQSKASQSQVGWDMDANGLSTDGHNEAIRTEEHKYKIEQSHLSSLTPRHHVMHYLDSILECLSYQIIELFAPRLSCWRCLVMYK